MNSPRFAGGIVSDLGCESAVLQGQESPALGRILGESEAIRSLRRTIIQVAPFKVCVVMAGETGTGKELAARAIHYLSPRATKPFVPVNCGAIPDSLFENELFGHVRGAFTDAHTAQTGLVAQADGGTLFLDEIGALSLPSQAKLLRLLQEEQYKRLGDSRPQSVNTRVLAASNTPLHTLVQRGLFREDLFYRLNVIPLSVPPLRERIGDIPLLVRHFLLEYSSQYGKWAPELTKKAMQAMISYEWPGNIRELQNGIKRMIIMSNDSVLDVESVPFPHNAMCAKASPVERFDAARKRVIDAFERAYLQTLLVESEGNVVQAAQRAGKSRTALWNILKRHSISPKQFCYPHHLR